MGDGVSTGAVAGQLMAQLGAFEALLLAAAAVHQSMRWAQSLLVVRRFAGIPGFLSAGALGIAIGAEILAASLLALPAYRVFGAALAAAVWTAYLALIVRAILEDRRDADCGCSFGPAWRPLGAFHVLRNTVLAGLAIVVACVSATVGSVAVEGSQWLGGLAVLTLYGALDQVMALRPLRAGEVL